MDIVDETCTENWAVALKIIILLSRGHLSSSQIEQLRELFREPIDWDTFYKLAIQHRVFPLVYRNVRKYCSGFVPEEVLEQGKQIFRNNGARNLMMTGYLVRILSLLKEHEIPAMPFKGAVLAMSLYGDSALRSFGDIDVLIPRRYLIKAVNILVTQGFFPTLSLNDQQLLKLSETDNEYPLVHTTSGVTLDLQWEITGGYFPSQIIFEDLFERHRTMVLASEDVSVFSDEDLLFYLCVHGNQHTWKQLDHVCCVAGLINKRPGLDFEAVYLTASKYKGVRMLCIGLLLAQDLLGATVSVQFAKRLQEDLKAVTLVRQIIWNLCSTRQLPTDAVSHRFMKYHLLSMDQPYLAIRYALRLFFMPTRYDWQVWPLPAHFSFLHYMIRPFRLGWEAIKTIIGCCRVLLVGEKYI